MPWLILLLSIPLLILAAAYWLLILTEGAYLGPRVVTWLYDWGASSYDAVKDYDSGDEAYFLGQPLAKALSRVRRPLILDVATGTGRLPLSLLHWLDFDGHIVALDRSRRMLLRARAKTAAYTGRVSLLLRDATRLPFIDGAFDAVTCIEALEFLPEAEATLREMVRVLRPGGTLLVTNRCGRDRWYFPGRAPSRAIFEAGLTALGLVQVETRLWQEYYDLVWARKPEADATPNPAPAAIGDEPVSGSPPTRGSRRSIRKLATSSAPRTSGRGLVDVWVCPACGAGEPEVLPEGFRCAACGCVYRRRDGILDMTGS